MNPRSLILPVLGAVSALALAPQFSAKAQSINWASVNYTAGSTNQQGIPISGTSNTAGFVFSGNTDRFATVSGASSATPLIGANSGTTSPNSVYANGGNAGQSALQLYMDFSANTQNVTLIVTFQTPVPTVSFSLFDVDAGTATTNGGVTTYTFQDQVSGIRASEDGTTYGINPTLSVAGDTTLSGANAAYGIATSNNNTGNANLNISFSNPAGIKSFEFTYGDHVDTSGLSGSTTTQTDPSGQIIAIGNIAVPEPGTVTFLVAGLVGLAAWLFRRRQQLA